MSQVAEEELMHYGVKRRSGRYPYGSGDDPYQHGRDLLGRVEEMRKQGITYTDPETGKTYTGDTAIAKTLGLTTGQFRTELGIAKDERRMLQVARAKSLREDGLGPTEIGREMGINESTVRSLLSEKSEARTRQAREIADIIKKEIDTRGMIDVGTGVERELNISKEKLNEALYLLEKEGYPIYKGGIPQTTNPGKQINQRVICPPGTEHKEIYNFENVHSLKEYISRDGGETLEKKFNYPESLDSKRLMVRYAEEGGLQKDGIVELRRGVADLSLGESRYSQVRILVDDTHYIKGMAVYSDDMPPGVDVIFNTNKKTGTPTKEVLKKIKEDPDNPFGSAIKDVEQGGQYWYDPKTGDRVSAKTPGAKLGLINKRADEGDWDEWSNALPSQFLSKQSKYMAQKQLNLAKLDSQAEFDEICALTNPTVKKHLLEEFANNCDAKAANLKAAALPGQKYHVIVPINSLKEDEVYAPGYADGTKLALVRYPHGGTFEIPILKVNNKNDLGDKIISKDSIDAVGINSKVAERLSGADFDGDTVMCIPTHDRRGRVKITSTDKLKDLEGFDPKDAYQYDKKTVDADGTEHYYRNGREFRVMKNTGTQMGVVSNLITDMTLAGASESELARAVKHSMVVIDAEKHKLDYKQSEADNDIASLVKTYQRKVNPDGSIKYGGASTIISRAKGEVSVDKRQGTPKVNVKGSSWYDPTKPEGSLIYQVADDVEYTYTKTNKRTGETTVATGRRKQQSTRMAETDDARTLMSDAKHPMEVIYADYANSMKSMANQARLEMVRTSKIKYDKNAKEVYQAEVSSLNRKLNDALLNSTREREAQRIANAEVSKKQQNYKEEHGTKMPADDLKKARSQAIKKARTSVGSIARRDRNIDITDREWEAIQAGAVSENTLKKILNNTSVDSLRQRATPRTTSTMSPAKVQRIQALRDSNYSLGQIANIMGVSTSTVSKYLKGE